MHSDLLIFIDGFRELSSGKLKDEITIELSRDGLEGESFGKFSGGERATCDLAIILAMQSIINATSISGGLNCLFVDEVLESVDDSGMNDIAACLGNLGQTIVLIAHSAPNMMVDCNRLTVEKNKGISQII